MDVTVDYPGKEDPISLGSLLSSHHCVLWHATIQYSHCCFEVGFQQLEMILHVNFWYLENGPGLEVFLQAVVRY